MKTNGAYAHIISGDPGRISHKRARLFAKAVDLLEKKVGHAATPEDVLKDAKKNPSSVFWLYLPKDPKKALRAVQLEAARHILSVAKAYFVDYKGRSVPTRIRENVIFGKDKARAYFKHEAIRGTKMLLKLHLRTLIEELENWFNRARTYKALGAKPLSAVENAIKAMKKNI